MGHIARTIRPSDEKHEVESDIPTTQLYRYKSRNLRMPYKHRTPQREMVAATEKINVTGQEKRQKYIYVCKATTIEG